MSAMTSLFLASSSVAVLLWNLASISACSEHRASLNRPQQLTFEGEALSLGHKEIDKRKG
jgi:hypothetical protein